MNFDVSVGKYFIAVKLPEDISLDLFSRINHILSKKELTLVPANKYHLTIFYLGYTSKERAINLFSKLDAIKLTAFKIRLKNIGYFNSRVIWLGVEDAENKLSELHRVYLRENINLHLTLARNKLMHKKELQKIIDKLRNLNLNYEFIVKEITLFESIPSSNGHIYKTICTKQVE